MTEEIITQIDFMAQKLLKHNQNLKYIRKYIATKDDITKIKTLVGLKAN